MTAKLVITMDDAVLDALRRTKSLTILLTKGGERAASSPRAGSLPARILAWAKKRKKPFETQDIVKRFKVSRGHASMLLVKLANGPYPVERRERGLYTSS